MIPMFLKRFLNNFLISLSFLLMGASFVQAHELELVTPEYVKALRPATFKAIFHHDDGTTTDVSHLSRFVVTDSPARQFGGGVIEFDLPYNLMGDLFYANVGVEVGFKGEIYSTHKMVRIDAAPDHMFITGPFYLKSGQMANFRMIGNYNGRSIDITNLVRWSATQGWFGVYGNYTAPFIPGPYATSVGIMGWFGARMQTFYVNINP